MTVHPPASIEPGAPSPHHGRRGFRRWLLIFGSVAVLVLIGAITVYTTTTTGTDEPDAAGQLVPPSPLASDTGPGDNTAPPTQLLETTAPAPTATVVSCRYVLGVLNVMMTSGDGGDYVETRRAAADLLRDVAEDYPGQREALETLADELDAAAQMVEDDPSPRTEQAAFERESAAGHAFFDSGACV